MIVVVVEWNTGPDGGWVDEEDRQPIEDQEFITNPCSIYGPFDDVEAADKWAYGALEDDMDVFDIYRVEQEFPSGWTINNPVEYPDGYKEVTSNAKSPIRVVLCGSQP